MSHDMYEKVVRAWKEVINACVALRRTFSITEHSYHRYLNDFATFTFCIDQLQQDISVKMSRAVNIFALFAVLSMATCVSLAPQSQPEQALQQPMASKLGCGAVNFVVTSYLPRPHANAFCSAYLQESTQAFGSTALPAQVQLPIDKRCFLC